MRMRTVSLLALSVYARYEAEGPGFVPAYRECWPAGWSMPPRSWGKIVGVDLADPASGMPASHLLNGT